MEDVSAARDRGVVHLRRFRERDDGLLGGKRKWGKEQGQSERNGELA
jgi:hypothetical protein